MSIEQKEIPLQSLEELYLCYGKRLCQHLASTFGQGTVDAEDIVQITFSRYSEHQKREEIDNPRAFLYRTARNLAIDEIRKRKVRLAHRESIANENEENLADLSPENVLFAQQQIEALKTLINKLPGIERRVLMMHRFENCSYSQIAQKTGMSETTIRRHVAKALERLHRGMKRLESGE